MLLKFNKIISGKKLLMGIIGIIGIIGISNIMFKKKYLSIDTQLQMQIFDDTAHDFPITLLTLGLIYKF